MPALRFPRSWRAAVHIGVIGVLGLLLLLLGVRQVAFDGPYQTPQPIPDGRIVDLHVHTAGIGAGDSGCFVSPALQQSYKFDLYLQAFYQRLRHHGLPLLSHTGQERSFTRANDALADPQRLRLPLSQGVTVIAAHVASTGSNAGEPDIDRLARMMAEFPHLYAEISSLTQVNKLGYLEQALRRPEFAGRLCYGSDFPLINTALVSPWYFPLNLTQDQMERVSEIANPWDRDVALKQALGVPQEVFERTASVVRRRIR